MNWPLLWALILAGGVIISNLMLLKYSARFQLPKPKAGKASDINQSDCSDGQKTNSPVKNAAVDHEG